MFFPGYFIAPRFGPVAGLFLFDSFHPQLTSKRDRLWTNRILMKRKYWGKAKKAEEKVKGRNLSRFTLVTDVQFQTGPDILYRR